MGYQTMNNRWMRGAAALLFALTLALPCAAGTQKTFASPEAAADALVDGLARQDDSGLRTVLGPDHERLIPLDDISVEDRIAFLEAWARGHRIKRVSDSDARLELDGGWTLPIPIVRTRAGWSFDIRAGREEMRTRRIGRNELAAIQSMHAYVEAQQEYAAQDRNGDASSNSLRKSGVHPAPGTASTGPRRPGIRRVRSDRCSIRRISRTATTATASGYSRRRVRRRGTARAAMSGTAA